MKKKVNFPLAVTFVVFCGVLLVVVVLQYSFNIKISSFIPLNKESDQITEDETTDWKIYRNEDYGFEIKYPSYLEMEDPEITAGYSSGSIRIKDHRTSCSVEYWVEVKETNEENIDKWASGFEEGLVVEYEGATIKADLISIEDVNIQDRIGRRILVDGGFPVFFNEYVGVINNSKIYIIKYIKIYNCPDDNVIFNEVLSTFRFID